MVESPRKEWVRLVESTREAIQAGHRGATSLAYTVLGLSLEHWLLSHPSMLSAAILDKITRYSERLGDGALRQRAEAAAQALDGG